jgi:hypothetical protein
MVFGPVAWKFANSTVRSHASARREELTVTDRKFTVATTIPFPCIVRTISTVMDDLRPL